MTIWKVWLTERRSRSWASWKDGLDGGGRDDDGLEGGEGGGQHGSGLDVDGRVVDRGGENGLAPLFNDADAVPTPNEIGAPGLWLARVADFDSAG